MIRPQNPFIEQAKTNYYYEVLSLGWERCQAANDKRNLELMNELINMLWLHPKCFQGEKGKTCLTIDHVQDYIEIAFRVEDMR